MKNIRTILAVLGAAFLLSGCYYDNFKELHPEGALPDPSNICDTTGVISYSAQIVPILNASCNQNCHNPTAGVGTGSGDDDLTSYAALSSLALSGRLYSSVSWDDVYTLEHMPDGGSKLPECDIVKIKNWAAAGALDN